MINPNAKHTIKGIVTEVSRYDDKTIKNIEVDIDGTLVESVLGLEHKTLKVGDRVSCVIGFRIVSDRYVLEGVRRCKN